MQLNPFRFGLGDTVRAIDDICVDSRAPAAPNNPILVPKEAIGEITALTVSKKGTHASVKFKGAGRTLLLNEGHLVRA